MTIGFGTIGAKSAGGTATVSVAYPSSPASGDLAVAGRIGWLDTITFTDEAGWDSRGSTPGGTGTAADSHTSEARIDTQVMTGAETGSVTFDQGGTISGAIGVMARYTKDPAATWDVQSNGATDNSHGANRTTAAITLDLEAGDWVIAVVAVDTDAALTITSPTFTADGVTFGTVNRRTSGAGVITGVDGNIELFDVPVATGAGGTTFSLTFTTATSQCGPIQFIRLREVTPPASAPATVVMAPMVPA